jgi:hypothetical protein
VRRTIKIVAWVALFSACAGAGAFVAAHTNPFPPGVEDPGVERTPTPTPTVTTTGPTGPMWKGGAGARTQHVLFVGGSCASNWRLSLRFTVESDGAVVGTGTARLQGKLRCDFPTAQAEARSVALRVGGRDHGNVLHLTLAAGAFSPGGSNDFGGLTHTLVRFPPVPVHGGEAKASGAVRIGDGDRGSYVATYHVHLFCVAGC